MDTPDPADIDLPLPGKVVIAGWSGFETNPPAPRNGGNGLEESGRAPQESFPNESPPHDTSALQDALTSGESSDEAVSTGYRHLQLMLTPRNATTESLSPQPENNTGAGTPSGGLSDQPGSTADEPVQISDDQPSEEINPSAPESDFVFFNALLFRDSPRLLELEEVFPRIRVAYASSLFSKDSDRSMPDEDAVRSYARKISPGETVILDIEHWELGPGVPEATNNETIDKLIQVLEWFREENPEVKLGYYMLLPHRSYWFAMREPDHPDYVRWEAHNQSLQRLADHVDVICPSLYTFYDDHAGWLRYARTNIEQARHYQKPVLPFLWFEYHNSTDLGGQAIPGDVWADQLLLCRELADGVIIWGGYQEVLDTDAEWWRRMENFLFAPYPPPIGD